MRHFLIATLLAVLTCWALDGSPAKAEGPADENRPARGAIAFASSRGGSWHIWIIDPDGRNELQVTQGAQDYHYPAWKPNAEKLACADNNGRIVIVSDNGTTESLPVLPENCTHPAWSPDGGKIAFVCHAFQPGREDSDIWVFDLKLGKAARLLEQADIQNYPDWSPDGSTIVYTSGYRASPTKVIEELWLVKADGSSPGRIWSNGFSNVHPQWSPDGKRIAFASDQTGNMEIWVMDADGKNPVQLTRDRAYDADPTWSPDGSRICFTSTRSGRMELWTMDASGANLKQLTDVSGADGESLEPHWSR